MQTQKNEVANTITQCSIPYVEPEISAELEGIEREITQKIEFLATAAKRLRSMARVGGVWQ